MYILKPNETIEKYRYATESRIMFSLNSFGALFCKM